MRLLTRLLLAVLQQNRQRRWRMKQRRPAVTEPRKTPVEQRESIEFRRLGLNSIWQEFGCLKSELVKKTYRSLVCIFRLCQVKSALFFSSHLKWVLSNSIHSSIKSSHLDWRIYGGNGILNFQTKKGKHLARKACFTKARTLFNNRRNFSRALILCLQRTDSSL